MIPRLPSNCEGVDKLLAGGIEQGTVSLVYGEAGTGKTSLALQLSREAIKAYPDHVVLFVDTEGLSLENASYIEENLKINEFNSKSENSPKLFNSDEEISEMDISKDIKEDDLFEKDFVNDEEFEIPAFLRKQKY